MTVSATENKRRNLKSSWKVAASDRVARQIITIGGLATIAAVLLVVFVLFSNVLPLFRETKLALTPVTVAFKGSEPTTESPTRPLLHSGIDEFTELAWFLDDHADVTVRAVHNGALLSRIPNDKSTAQSPAVTATFRDRAGNQLLLGHADGSVQSVRLQFETKFVRITEIEPEVAAAFKSAGDAATLINVGDSTYRKLAGQLVRRQRLSAVNISEAYPLTSDKSAIQHLVALPAAVQSSFNQSTQTVFLAISPTTIASGILENKTNQLNDSITAEWSHQSTAIDTKLNATKIVSAMIHQQGNLASIALRDGQMAKYRIGDAAPELISVDPISYPYASNASSKNVSAATVLLGDNTLLLGSDSGEVVGTFIASGTNADGKQAETYVAAHSFNLSSTPIRLIAASPSSRMFAAIDEQSKLTLCYAPNDAVLNESSLALKNPKEIWFSVRQDKVGILASDELKLFDLSVAYPEASFKSLFMPLWYEGYSQPESIWQSSSAGVDAESKLSMRPLIFGTLKATFFSLLIAVPLALMAAIYSSEFLSTPVRLRVKPVIELMAGIPSVVLGFIAAFVLARIFREHLMTILLSFFTLMFTLGLFGNLWLLLPQQVYLRLERFRILLLLILVPLGLSMAWFIGPIVEHWMFGRTLVEWLNGASGSSAWPGWFMLFIPISILIVLYLSSTVVSSILRPLASRWAARPFALLMVGRYLANCLVMLLLAGLLASILTMTGLDPRGTFFGGYQERNALLVGAILGFAIIPIIYTISEDALQAVPQHLRSASLGCGATPWQTTTRIVLPTAMSGLFGGVMIGFGRAVGETMVVLMAAGNTPVMDINPFNGYRTLSATLATELPEAARASAHFHTLFLAAFLLFCFTLVANTLAEFVRMRFRKRSFQL